MRFLQTVLFWSQLCTIAILSGFVWIAHLIGQQRIVAFDTRMTELIGNLSSDEMTLIMKAFTAIGSGFYVVLIALLFILVLAGIGYRRELFFFVGIICCSSLINIILKLIFHRTRPDIHRIIEVSGYSFPSGHSMSAFSLYGIAVYFLWKHLHKRWVRLSVFVSGLIVVLMIGASRIYLGVHFPSDVIGGYLMSAAWLAASIGLYEQFLKKRWLSKKLTIRSD